MEVPFALTNADWPALVVTRRAPSFDPSRCGAGFWGGVPEGALLGAIWAAENPAALETFLAEPAHEEGLPVKLRAEAARSFPFTRNLSGAQSKWVLLQFFSRARPPRLPRFRRWPRRSEMEGDFLLQEADWPAFLLLKTTGSPGNRAAVRASVPKLKSRMSAGHNLVVRKPGVAGLQFLGLPAPTLLAAPQVPPQKRPAGDLSGPGHLPAARRGCLLQLLKEPPAPAPGGAAGPPVLEAHSVQRQKLDCALQLARSVALDFNNALTASWATPPSS